VVAVAVAGEVTEAEMAGHFEAGGVVEVKAKAKVVVGRVEEEEVGMVAVEGAADTEVHHGHIVAEGDEVMSAAGAEKLAQVQPREMQLQDKEMIMRASRRGQERPSLANYA